MTHTVTCTYLLTVKTSTLNQNYLTVLINFGLQHLLYQKISWSNRLIWHGMLLFKRHNTANYNYKTLLKDAWLYIHVYIISRLLSPVVKNNNSLHLRNCLLAEWNRVTLYPIYISILAAINFVYSDVLMYVKTWKMNWLV